jgi:hypothetical protein
VSDTEGTPRKTLDEIRRELDADYPSSVTPASQNGGAAESSAPYPVPAVSVDENEKDERHETDGDGLNAPVVDETRVPPRRRTRRLRYIVAGVAGCLAGQLVLIGILIAVRQWHSAALDAPIVRIERAAPKATSESHIADQRAISDDASAPTSAVVSPTTPEPAPSKPGAVAGERGPAISERGPTASEPSPAASEPKPKARQSDSPTTSSGAAASEPKPKARQSDSSTTSSGAAASEPKPKARQSDSSTTSSGAAASEPKPKARRNGRSPAAEVRAVAPPAPTPSEGREEPIESRNWAQSQDQVRAALSEWLARAGHRDDTNVSDIVVILSADGRTARTHVPLKSGSDVIVREQRWERGANGWQIMDDREAWRAR